MAAKGENRGIFMQFRCVGISGSVGATCTLAGSIADCVIQCRQFGNVDDEPPTESARKARGNLTTTCKAAIALVRRHSTRFSVVLHC